MRLNLILFVLFTCCLYVDVCVAEQPGETATPKAKSRPNIILVYADDISAREFPTYGSSTWTKEKGVDTSGEAFRAKTPVLDQLAKEGCWIKTAWVSVVCSPSRAMMMTKRMLWSVANVEQGLS